MPRSPSESEADPIPDDWARVTAPRPQSRALVLFKNVGGRPRIGLTEDQTDVLCDAIADGKKLAEIAELPGMPSRATLRRSIARNIDLLREYVLAKEEFCDGILLDTIAIADDDSDDVMMTESDGDMPVVVANKKAIGRSELAIDTRFRLASKVAPRRYGDVIQEAIAQPAATPASYGEKAQPAVPPGERVIPLEQHPLYDSIVAWGRVAREPEPK